MNNPYMLAEDTPGRAYVDVDAELDNFDLEDEIALGSDDLNYALGRPTDVDFDEE